MKKKLVLNPLTGRFDLVGNIPQLSSDPASPALEDAWVLRTVTPNANTGSPMGLLLSLTYPPDYSYQFSFRTKEGNTLRTTLS